MTSLNQGEKAIINTGILYARMLITVGISLFTTRLVLNALGAADYGLYNLVAGIVAMLSFLNAAMTTSTQRFISYYQGKKDLKMQKIVFSNSLLLHISIGLLIILIMELISFYMFDGYLNIPNDKLLTAKLLYHMMSISVFFTIVSVPFSGVLAAHENMLWIALTNIVEVILKFGIALILNNVNTYKLIFYGWTMASVSIISMMIYTIYCCKNYKECTLNIKPHLDKSLMKELGSFAGWNLFGAACGIGRVQGLAIILNLFFGTIVNAAYSIANQIATQLSFFSIAMLQALNPQIMKSEGIGDRQRMLHLSMMASKFSFFLLAFIAIPSIVEMESILKFWLKNIPDYTIILCVLLLIGLLVNQLTIGIQSGLQAIGNIKIYQAVVGTIILLNLPIAYLLLKLELPIYSSLFVYIIIELGASSFRLYFLKKVGNLSIQEYLRKVPLKIIFPLLTIILTSIFIKSYIEIPFRFIINLFVSFILFSLSIYHTGLEVKEKLKIQDFFSKKINVWMKRTKRSILNPTLVKRVFGN